MSEDRDWYVVKESDGTCRVTLQDPTKTPKQEHWGSYGSEQEAIAKRIGLIRAGKCRPQ